MQEFSRGLGGGGGALGKGSYRFLRIGCENSQQGLKDWMGLEQESQASHDKSCVLR